MRAFIFAMLIGSAIYGFYTGKWDTFSGCVPFALGFTPAYLKLRSWAQWHKNSIVMSFLVFLPMPIASVFLTELVRHGWLPAVTLTMAFTAGALIFAALIYLLMDKRRKT